MKHLFILLAFLIFYGLNSPVEAQPNLSRVDWNRDGSLVAGVSGNGLIVMDRAANTTITKSHQSFTGGSLSNYLANLDWHPSISNLLAVLDDAGDVYLLQYDGNEMLVVDFFDLDDSGGLRLHWNVDGRYIAVSNGTVGGRSSLNFIDVMQRTIVYEHFGVGQIDDFAWNPQIPEQILISDRGTLGGSKLTLYNLEQATVLWEREYFNAQSQLIAWAPEGHMFAGVDTDIPLQAEILIYDGITGDLIENLQSNLLSTSDVSWAPASDIAVLGLSNVDPIENAIEVWDTETLQPRSPITLPGSYRMMAWNIHGEITYSGETIIILPIQSSSPLPIIQAMQLIDSNGNVSINELEADNPLDPIAINLDETSLRIQMGTVDADYVEFSLNGQTTVQDTDAPFELPAWYSVPGEYRVTATPYTLVNGVPIRGIALTVDLSIPAEPSTSPADGMNP